MARPLGFTLLEVLVVLAIVAVLAGLAARGLRGDPGRVVELEGWRLARLLDRLDREAALTGESLALRWDAAGYGAYRQQADGRWTALAGDPVFQPRALPAGLRLAKAGEARFLPGRPPTPVSLRLDGPGARVEVRQEGFDPVRVARLAGELPL